MTRLPNFNTEKVFTHFTSLFEMKLFTYLLAWSSEEVFQHNQKSRQELCQQLEIAEITFMFHLKELTRNKVLSKTMRGFYELNRDFIRYEENGTI